MANSEANDQQETESKELRLDTWKEIAVYLKRDVRTARRWEGTRGLPVHRLSTGPRSQVFAYQSEIDAWLRHPGNPSDDESTGIGVTKPERRFKLFWVLGPFAVLVLFAIAFWPRGVPALPSITHRPLTTDMGEEWYPSFSPDGREVAYIWRTEDGSTDVYRRNVESGITIRLTNNAEEEHCTSWSPDGKTLAYCQELSTNQSALVLRSLSDDSERELTSGFVPRDLDVGQSIAWSPDGRYMVAAIEKAWAPAVGLHRIDIQTGEWTRLTNPEALSDSEPAVSPDGATLVFQHLFSRAQSDLFLVPLGPGILPLAPPERLTTANTYTYTSSPSFFPDGKSILFARGPFGDRRLHRMALAHPDRVEALSTLAEYLLMPVLSRDGTRLSYVRRSFDTNLWRLEVDAKIQPIGVPQRVIASSRGEGNPAYSPDGSHIAFDSSRNGNNDIWIADANGFNARRVAGFEDAPSGSPSWAPDGMWLAFDARLEEHADIYIVSAGGGEPRRLTTNAADDLLPSWSPDGHWILFGSNRTGRWEIWRTPVGGGAEEQVSRKGALFHRVARDGTVFVTQSEGRDEDAVVRLLPDGAEQSVLAPIYWYNCFDLLNGGLVFMPKPSKPNGPTELRFRDAKGNERTILELGRAAGFGLTVSPDGRWITWTQQDGNTSDLMLVEGLR